MHSLLVGPLVALAASAAAAPVPAGKPALREKDPPAEWKLADLNEQMPRRWDKGVVHVLAWGVIDDGERVTERALVAKEFVEPNEARETFAVGYLVRFPKDPELKWKARLLHVTKQVGDGPPLSWPMFGYECYTDRPTDRQIGAFLAAYSWADQVKPSQYLSNGKWHDRNPKLTDGGVGPKAWKDALDRAPPVDLFPELRLDRPAK